MTLPVSGNPIKMSQVDVELGLSSTAQLNVGASRVRKLFGKLTGNISFSDGFGKFYYSAISGFNALTAVNGSTAMGMAAAVAVNNSGVIVATGSLDGYPNFKASFTRSTDGSTWTTPALINGSTTISRMSGIVALPSGKFVTVGYHPVTNNGGGFVSTSSDGITWTSPTSIGAVNWNSVCYNPKSGRIVAAGDNGSYQAFAYSDNEGASWSTPAINTAVFGLIKAVCWNPVLNLYAATGWGFGGKPIWQTSTDGVTWTSPVLMNATPGSLNSITSLSTGRFVAVGSSTAAGGGGFGIYGYSDDGVTWTTGYTVSSSTNGDLYGVSVNDSNQIVAVGYNGATGHPFWIKSNDGASWGTINELTTGSVSGVLIAVATRPDGRFVTVGYNNNAGNVYPWYANSY